MARRGSFGKAPRSAPDLTGSIVALMREFAAMQERNLLDAWKSGGEIDGKRVTDEMLLKHFDTKLGELSPDDPLYDEAHNTAEQYRFAIRNSKMELGYHQKKITDAGMAAFYRKEAANHPRNSEAWRNLMSLSADYAHRARNSSGGGGGGGGSAYAKAVAKAKLAAKIENPRSVELGYDAWKDDILDLARQRGIINNSENPDTGSVTAGQGFADLQIAEEDFSKFTALIDEYATSPAFAPRRQQLVDWIRANGNPEFDGDFTMQGLTKLYSEKMRGIDNRLQLAMSKGTKTQFNKVAKERTLTGKEGASIRVVDPLTQYEEGRKQRDMVLDDPNATVLDRIEANAEWASTLTDIYNRVGAMIPAERDDGGQTSVIFGRLGAELQSLMGDKDGSKGTPTLYEESRPFTAGARNNPNDSDNASTAEMVNKDNYDFGLLASGAGVLTKVDPKTGAPLQEGQAGGTWSVVDASALDAAGPRGTFLVTNAAHGGNVRAPFIDPATGDWAVDPTTGQFKTRVQSTNFVMQATRFQPINVIGEGGLDSAGRPTVQLDLEERTRSDIGGVVDLGNGDFVYRYQDSDGNIKFTTEPWWKTEMADGSPVNVIDNTASGGGMVLSFMGDVTGKKKYDPNEVVQDLDRPLWNKASDWIDGFHYDAETNRMSRDIYSSGYVAAAVAKDIIKTLSPTQIALGIAAETGDLTSPEAQAALGEADKVKAQTVIDTRDWAIERRYTAREGEKTGGVYVPKLTDDDKKMMPLTAAATSSLQLQQSEDKIRRTVGPEGVKELRNTALKIMGAVGQAFDPTGALGLSDMLRNGLRNTMTTTTAAAAKDPVFSPTGPEIVKRAVTGAPTVGTSPYQPTPPAPAPAPVAPAPKPPAPVGPTQAPTNIGGIVIATAPPPPKAPPYTPPLVKGPAGAPQPF